MSKYERITADLNAQRAKRGETHAHPVLIVPTAPSHYLGRTKDTGPASSGKEFMLVANIVPDPLQPRKDIDPEKVAALAASLKTHGQLVPIVIEWNPELGKWVIEDGERRWLAAQMLGWDRLACVFLLKEMSPAERLEKQLVIDGLREALKPIERANAYVRLMKLGEYTQQQLADRLKVSQPSVAKTLALLDAPPAIQDGVAAGTIPASVVEELVKIEDPAEQAEAVEKVVAGKMTRGDVRDAVKKKKSGGFAQKASKIITHKLAGCKATLVFRKTPTDADIRAALLEMLSSYPEEKQQAA